MTTNEAAVGPIILRRLMAKLALGLSIAAVAACAGDKANTVAKASAPSELTVPHILAASKYRNMNATEIATWAAVRQAIDADAQIRISQEQSKVSFVTLAAAVVAAFFAGWAALHTRRGADAANTSAESFLLVEDASLIGAFPDVQRSAFGYAIKPVLQITNVGRSAAFVHMVSINNLSTYSVVDRIVLPNETADFTECGEIADCDGVVHFLGRLSYSTALSKNIWFNLKGVYSYNNQTGMYKGGVLKSGIESRPAAVRGIAGLLKRADGWLDRFKFTIDRPTQ